MEFDLDPRDPFPRSADWQYWFAAEAGVSTFTKLLAGESYEIFVATNADPAVLEIKGRPVLNPARWLPGEANLVGLPVSSNTPISFTDFFSFSSDFVMSPATATVFRVSGPNNTLQRVWTPATERPGRGEAFWIVAGPNARQYNGPIQVRTETPSRLLDFGPSISPRTLVIQNLTTNSRSIQIRQQASAAPPALPGIPGLLGPVPLLYKDALTDQSYQPFPEIFETNLAPRARLDLSLAPDPQALTNGTPNSAWQSLLRITDAHNAKFTPATVDLLVGVSCDGRVANPADVRGLWIGQVTVTDVERAATRLGVVNAWAADGPVPVSQPFVFRVIVHVDALGTVRLLQRALLAWRLEETDPERLAEPPTNAVLEILSDESAAAAYSVQYPDAKIVRISSPNFPLMSPVSAATGSVFGASMDFDVTIPFDDPVNPFLHRYHPQHDNLRYDNGVATNVPEGVESYTISRALQFRFSPIDPVLGVTNRQWGIAEQGGMYEETVNGLNKTIRTRGTFRLQRVSSVDEVIN